MPMTREKTWIHWTNAVPEATLEMRERLAARPIRVVLAPRPDFWACLDYEIATFLDHQHWKIDWQFAEIKANIRSQFTFLKNQYSEEAQITLSNTPPKLY